MERLGSRIVFAAFLLLSGSAIRAHEQSIQAITPILHVELTQDELCDIAIEIAVLKKKAYDPVLRENARELERWYKNSICNTPICPNMPSPKGRNYCIFTEKVNGIILTPSYILSWLKACNYNFDEQLSGFLLQQIKICN